MVELRTQARKLNSLIVVPFEVRNALKTFYMWAADSPSHELHDALEGGCPKLRARTWQWVRDVDIGQDVPQERVPTAMADVDVSDEQKEFFWHLIDYSYPSIIETSDGLMAVSYTFRRRTIKYASFDESWIKGGGTLGFFTGDR